LEIKKFIFYRRRGYDMELRRICLKVKIKMTNVSTTMNIVAAIA